jgi:hypothetical protein
MSEGAGSRAAREREEGTERERERRERERGEREERERERERRLIQSIRQPAVGSVRVCVCVCVCVRVRACVRARGVCTKRMHTFVHMRTGSRVYMHVRVYSKNKIKVVPVFV